MIRSQMASRLRPGEKLRGGSRAPAGTETAADRLAVFGHAIHAGGVPTQDRGARHLGKAPQQLVRRPAPPRIPARALDDGPVAAPDHTVRAEGLQDDVDVRAEVRRLPVRLRLGDETRELAREP